MTISRSTADGNSDDLSTDARVPIDYEAIAQLCRRWEILELALFGSVLRDDFGPDSDVDVLVTFAPDARTTLFDLARIREELEGIFGREIDLLTRRGVETSRNPYRRDSILRSARPLYVA